MFSLELAEVTRVVSLSEECQELAVTIAGRPARAVNYLRLTGPVFPGDRVVLNTTAVELGLGSGGYHFVYINLARPEKSIDSGPGHIIKMRYTPMQLRVLAVEEEASPYHALMSRVDSLMSMPVIVAELHSMLAPVVLAVKKQVPSARVAYLMTDGGALPACLSRTVHVLRCRGLLCGVISCGHAFGGDLEAVNVYSGLLAARHILRADLAVICMGPGVVGTCTPFGFSGIEMGDNINRVHALNGIAVALPRISYSDRRARHRGLSHHTVTALATAALAPAHLPLPRLEGSWQALLESQLAAARLAEKHRVIWLDDVTLDDLDDREIDCSTMGRGVDEDRAFFLAAVAAGRHAAGLLHFSGTSRR